MNLLFLIYDSNLLNDYFLLLNLIVILMGMPIFMLNLLFLISYLTIIHLFFIGIFIFLCLRLRYSFLNNREENSSSISSIM
jgi:hypothetical protein